MVNYLANVLRRVAGNIGQCYRVSEQRDFLMVGLGHVFINRTPRGGCCAAAGASAPRPPRETPPAPLHCSPQPTSTRSDASVLRRRATAGLWPRRCPSYPRLYRKRCCAADGGVRLPRVLFSSAVSTVPCSPFLSGAFSADADADVATHPYPYFCCFLSFAARRSSSSACWRAAPPRSSGRPARTASRTSRATRSRSSTRRTTTKRRAVVMVLLDRC